MEFFNNSESSGRVVGGGICGGTGTVQVRDWRLGVRGLDREGVTRASGRGVAECRSRRWVGRGNKYQDWFLGGHMHQSKANFRGWWELSTIKQRSFGKIKTDMKKLRERKDI